MAKKETKKENNKNKKSFFKDFKAELKKVNWPTPKQLVNNTIAVITLNKQGVDKIKELVVNTNTTQEATGEATDNNTTQDISVNETEQNTSTENNAQ